ncbi:MAG: DUF4386 domain-containing protein [Candidatus Dormibacteraeota bacterium]|nr:DUF4386 domain-containing protein [Candidatus Dormibacteraeota bacterium]
MVRSDAPALRGQATPTRLSPRARARLTGLFQLLEGVTSVIGQQYVLTKVVVHGDAAATARNIEAQEALFRLGFASSVAGVAFHVVWAFLFYQLFRPVNRTLAAVATLIIVVGCGVQALAAVLYGAPLAVLQGVHSLSGLNASQSQGLALAFLNLNSDVFNTYLVFFGLWLLLAGYLIARSTFMPRIFGLLLMLDGLGWSLYLWPPLAMFVFPAIAVVSALAELPLMVWLLVFGVNPQRWEEQAEASGGGSGRGGSP